MAITGSWAERQTVQSGASKWGHGWNPVHRERASAGRQVAPIGNTGYVEPGIVEESYDYEPRHDDVDTIYGYGEQTGTADRPGWTDPEREVEGFPSWGEYQAGLPGGTSIRAEDHGADLSYVSRNTVAEPAMAGWLNKQHGAVNNAVTSDPAQYERTTSYQQRDAVRAGSQSSGRADEHDSPIQSRITGMKDRSMVGDPYRREAMTPQVQTMRVRPWWPRQAGTGPRANMVNDGHIQVPLTRVPPSIPDTGAPVGGVLSGWTDEDGGWY